MSRVSGNRVIVLERTVITAHLDHQMRAERRPSGGLSRPVRPSGTARIAAGPCAEVALLVMHQRFNHFAAPRRVTEDYFGFQSEFSHCHDLPFNIHTLETKT